MYTCAHTHTFFSDWLYLAVLQENTVVLQSSAVAYVSLNSPVRGTETLRATASPTLLQLTSDIQRVGANSSHQGFFFF